LLRSTPGHRPGQSRLRPASSRHPRGRRSCGARAARGARSGGACSSSSARRPTAA